MGFLDWWGHHVTQSDGVPTWEKWAVLALVSPLIIGWFVRGSRR